MGPAEAAREPGSLCLLLAPAEAGALARSAPYPFGAPPWGCPWQVLPASVLGCVRTGGWRVWTRSLTRLVSRTVRCSTGDSAGAPGLFRVDVYTSPCESEDATPGSRASVRVRVRPGRVGRAGLLGAFWCASPSPLAALCFCFAWPPPGWGCPFLGPLFACPSFAFFFLSSVVVFRAPPFSIASFGFRPRVPWALTLCVVCFVGLALLGCPCALASFVLPDWPLAALWWLPPPPSLCLAVFVAAARCLAFFFSSCLRPRCLSLSLVSGPGCPGPWRCALCFFLPPPSRLSVRSRLFCVSRLAVGCSLVVAAPPPPLPFESRGFRRCGSVPCFVSFLFLCAPPLSLAFSGFHPRVPWASELCFVCFVGLPLPGSPCALALFVCPARPLAAPWWLLPPPLFVSRGFRRCRSVLRPFFCFFSLRCAPPFSLAFSGFRPQVPWASALCVVCFVGPLLLGSPCAVASFVLPAWLLAALMWLLPPPPPFVSRGFRRCRSVRCAVCCAVLCVPGCGAAPRWCALCRPVLCCCVLCCFVALVWCRCLLCRALCRCPSPWGPVFCGAVFCGVPPRCVLCAACFLSWRGGARCCSPLCFVLCVSWGAVLCVPCPLRSVRCCASLCWCACVVLFGWCVLLCVVLFPLVCYGAVLGLVPRCCLLVACYGVGVPVWPRGLLPCCWCGSLWCTASLCRVLWCCAVAWCCTVVTCCRVAVLSVLALPSCGLWCCAVLCCWLAVLSFARWWCLRAVVLFPSCCAFPVSSALCVGVPCCAGCGTLLPCVVCCGAVLSRGAVLSCSAVV